MGVYSAQYHQNADDVNAVIESANGEDVFGCCSIVLQIDENHTLMSFRRDSNYSATVNIDKVNWHGIPAIKQYKDEGSYFTHVIVTHDGWVLGFGGIDDGADNRKCEEITSKMINDNYTINKSSLKEIQKIKKPYGRGHMIIKAPNGNYGFVNVDKIKTGKLEPGEYKSIPNNYSLSRSGNLSLDSDDLIGDMVNLSQTDKYGQDRRDITVYDVHSTANNNTTEIYISNEDGSKINASYADCVDSVDFGNTFIDGSDIPIAPKYKYLGDITFTDEDLNPDNTLANIILVGVVVFIALLSYGVYRFMRFIKSRIYR